MGRKLRFDTKVLPNSVLGRSRQARRILDDSGLQPKGVGQAKETTRNRMNAASRSPVNRHEMSQVSSYWIEIVAPKKYGGFTMSFKKKGDIKVEDPQLISKEKNPRNLNIECLRVVLNMARTARKQVAVKPDLKPVRQGLYESLVLITTGQEPSAGTRASKVAEAFTKNADIAKVSLAKIENSSTTLMKRVNALVLQLISCDIDAIKSTQAKAIAQETIELADLAIALAIKLDYEPVQMNRMLTNIYKIHNR